MQVAYALMFLSALEHQEEALCLFLILVGACMLWRKTAPQPRIVTTGELIVHVNARRRRELELEKKAQLEIAIAQLSAAGKHVDRDAIFSDALIYTHGCWIEPVHIPWSA